MRQPLLSLRSKTFLIIMAIFVIASSILIGYRVVKNRIRADSTGNDATSDLLKFPLPTGAN